MFQNHNLNVLAMTFPENNLVFLGGNYPLPIPLPSLTILIGYHAANTMNEGIKENISKSSKKELKMISRS